ncbi:hypothetical protein PR048_031234 [Dryococelus australis]|uniref:Uncharacterized protein n=1 Tax=Dryococelus australis TaxID=614101 RepID=A0ABQ9G7K9_9NEOP|nr:hypothetical protein PR048_031234 [Dryococelus australis]
MAPPTNRKAPSPLPIYTILFCSFHILFPSPTVPLQPSHRPGHRSTPSGHPGLRFPADEGMELRSYGRLPFLQNNELVGDKRKHRGFGTSGYHAEETGQMVPPANQKAPLRFCDICADNADIKLNHGGSHVTGSPCKVVLRAQEPSRRDAGPSRSWLQANATLNKHYLGPLHSSATHNVQRTPENVGPANIRTFLDNYNKLQADSASSAQREPIAVQYVNPHTWRGMNRELGCEEVHRGSRRLSRGEVSCYTWCDEARALQLVAFMMSPNDGVWPKNDTRMLNPPLQRVPVSMKKAIAEADVTRDEISTKKKKKKKKRKKEKASPFLELLSTSMRAAESKAFGESTRKQILQREKRIYRAKTISHPWTFSVEYALINIQMYAGEVTQLVDRWTHYSGEPEFRYGSENMLANKRKTSSTITASQIQSRDTYETPYDRVKRCRERKKKNIYQGVRARQRRRIRAKQMDRVPNTATPHSFSSLGKFVSFDPVLEGGKPLLGGFSWLPRDHSSRLLRRFLTIFHPRLVRTFLKPCLSPTSRIFLRLVQTKLQLVQNANEGRSFRGSAKSREISPLPRPSDPIHGDLISPFVSRPSQTREISILMPAGQKAARLAKTSGTVDRAIPSGALVVQWLERVQEIPEKTCRPATSSGTIPTCKDTGMTPPAIELGLFLVGGEWSNRYANAAPDTVNAEVT